MQARRFQAFCLTLIAVLLAMTGCGQNSDVATEGASTELDKEVNVFNWSELLPESVIKKFEEKYGVKVNYSTFSSDEEMYAKLSAGGAYDLAVAAPISLVPLIEQGLIQTLDHQNIPNFKNILPEFTNHQIDPGNNYSIPFLGSVAALAVNTSKVTTEITSYKDLWKPELQSQLVVLDNTRFTLGMVLKTLGYSINDTDPQHLEEAKQQMAKLLPNIKAFDADSPKTFLTNGEAAVGFVWGPEIALAQKDVPEIKTVLPEEGVIYDFTYFVIPKNAKNKKTAEAFVNFLLEPEISAEISAAFPYINPNGEARKLIDKSVLDNPALYPPKEIMAESEMPVDLGEATSLYDRIWTEIKSMQ